MEGTTLCVAHGLSDSTRRCTIITGSLIIHVILPGCNHRCHGSCGVGMNHSSSLHATAGDVWSLVLTGREPGTVNSFNSLTQLTGNDRCLTDSAGDGPSDTPLFQY